MGLIAEYRLACDGAESTRDRELARYQSAGRQSAGQVGRHGGPGYLIEAAAPVLKELAAARGFTELAVFGSVARGDSFPDSDIDLIVRPPAGATIEDVTDLQALLARVVGRSVDLVSYGGLKPGLEDDVLREAVPL